MRPRRHWGIWVALAISLAICGCNLFGKVDNPKSLDEHLSSAQALMDAGKCQDAVNDLKGINVQGIAPANDRFYQVFGWAQLCAAGVPFSKVAGTLLTFNTSSTNSLQVVGSLVTAIGPANGNSINAAGSAKTTFSQISDSNKSQRLIYAALADVVQAAMFIGKSASNGVSAHQSDIAAAGCLGVNCTTSSGNCPINTVGNMPDADATAFFNDIQDASGQLGQGTGFGAASDLVGSLINVLGSGAQNVVRCAIVNNMLSN